MSFYFWLKRKYGRENNLFGNLIEMLEADKVAPRRASREETIRRYLINKRIPLKMMRAFNKAYKDYKKEREENEKNKI